MLNWLKRSKDEYDPINDEKFAEDDKVIERDGAKIVIDETSLEYLKGAFLWYFVVHYYSA